MEFIIVTGMSGAGKSRAINALEDIGFYCVDNIPPQLIPVFYELCEQSKNPLKKVAVVTDIRGGIMFDDLLKTLEGLNLRDRIYKILFLDARDHILIGRYKETRRRHPLSNKFKSVEQSVKHEREALKRIRSISDYIIDTSFISPSQLKNRIIDLFLNNCGMALVVNCMSFGFKYGIPSESDLLFDVRCLPNPFYIEKLKDLTGLDKPVKDYVMKFEQTKGFINHFLGLIDYMLPLYQKEGKSELVISVGCTGGKHRSVVLSQLLYEHLIEKDQRTNVLHRDIKI